MGQTFLKKKMFASRLLRQAVARKAPLANGPLKCPNHMDGIKHTETLIFLQSFGGIFFGALGAFAFFRYQWWVRKGEYYKYLDRSELKNMMMDYGVFPRDPTEWQKANVAKAKAAAEGDDDDDE